MCSFTVAVNRRREKDTADFFRVTTWRELADSCGKYLTKARQVCVVGTVSVSTYTTQGGQTRATMEVTAQDVEFLGQNQQSQQYDKPRYVEVKDEELPWA